MRITKSTLYIATTVALLATATIAKAQAIPTEAVQLVSETRYVNSTSRDQAGFGRSRLDIKVDLPDNTVKWYYSYSTKRGEGQKQLLQLAMKLTTALQDPSGMTAMAEEALLAPKGEGVIDIHVVRSKDLAAFYNGDQYPSLTEGRSLNATEGTRRIDDATSGTLHLTLSNPDPFNGISVTVEVVALVKVEEKAPEGREKGELYGRMGWNAYNEGGDLAKATELSLKALEFDPTLPWVHANLGLFSLIKGDQMAATDHYIEAIALYRKWDAATAKSQIAEVMADIREARKRYPSLSGYDGIVIMLHDEHARY